MAELSAQAASLTDDELLVGVQPDRGDGQHQGLRRPHGLVHVGDRHLSAGQPAAAALAVRRRPRHRRRTATERRPDRGDDRLDRGSADRRCPRRTGPADPAGQRTDGQAPDAAIPADPAGPPRHRAHERQLGPDPVLCARAWPRGRSSVDPDGGLQQLGRSVRAPPPRRSRTFAGSRGSTTTCGGRSCPTARRCTSSTTASSGSPAPRSSRFAKPSPARSWQRVVLDIRHNFGGEVPVLDEIEPIFDDPAVDQPGKLFVLVGRNTWSAGSMLLARLEAHTDAVLVGEPMARLPDLLRRCRRAAAAELGARAAGHGDARGRRRPERHPLQHRAGRRRRPQPGGLGERHGSGSRPDRPRGAVSASPLSGGAGRRARDLAAVRRLLAEPGGRSPPRRDHARRAADARPNTRSTARSSSSRPRRPPSSRRDSACG